MKNQIKNHKTSSDAIKLKEWYIKLILVIGTVV